MKEEWRSVKKTVLQEQISKTAWRRWWCLGYTLKDDQDWDQGGERTWAKSQALSTVIQEMSTQWPLCASARDCEGQLGHWTALPQSTVPEMTEAERGVCVCVWRIGGEDSGIGLRGGGLQGRRLSSWLFWVQNIQGSKISDHIGLLFSTSYKRCLMWKEREIALTELLPHANESVSLQYSYLIL